MLSKIKTILRYLKPYQRDEIENKFVELNSGLWKSEKSTRIQTNRKKEYCLVEGIIACPASIMDKARIAKAIQQETGVQPVVYIRGFNITGSNVSHIYNSFNINHFYCWWRGFFHPKVFVPAVIATLKTMLGSRSAKSLINLNYRGVEIGDLIYDTLIRFRPNEYTVKKIEVKHLRLIFRSFLTFHNNELMLEKYNPKYLVTSHNVYAEFGMLPRQIRHHNNGIVFLKDIYAYKCYGPAINIKEHFLKPTQEAFLQNLHAIDFVDRAYKYFYDRLEGNVDQIDVKNAYQNKKKYSIEQLKYIYPKVDIRKKNVVVMSHAFSDSPHVGEGLLFNDYYDFLEKTLIRLNKNRNINCFVKAHPSSYMWNEKGGVESLIEANQLDNIYMMPVDLNTNSIADFADSIVTAKGTAGLEFSCLGIPAVTAGKGYYAGFGITLEPESVQSYYNILDSISGLAKLDDEVRKRALVLLYMVSLSRRHSDILPKQHIMPHENYNDVYLSKYQEIIANIENNIPMRDGFYEEVIQDVVKNHD
ncbi:hypothetical protein ACI1OW_000048 [Escherichia coli]